MPYEKPKISQLRKAGLDDIGLCVYGVEIILLGTQTFRLYFY
jgi:hypothetical protein